MALTPEQELQLASDIGQLADWPLECVKYLFPWGKGFLSNFEGPLNWQCGFLNEWGQEIRLRGFDGSASVDPIRFSTTSGHGIGKSALCAFITHVIMTTRPMAKGVVTANTYKQLETKTWAEIAKWGRMSVCAHWFKITSGRGSMSFYHKQNPESWRCDGVAWREGDSEAFAGQHAVSSTSFYLMDEASAVPRSIFETAEGGLTDGEPMQFLFGNPTRNSGFFFDSHNSLKHRFICRGIDSRTVEITNKRQLQTLVDDYGEESDIVKVRVRGIFPEKGFAQLISMAVVEVAQSRPSYSDIYDPVIFGVDVARFGGDDSVIFIRRGRDARSIPFQVHSGLDTQKLALEVDRLAQKYKPDAIFVDGGGVGGGVVDRLRELKTPNVIEVNFGWKTEGEKTRDMGAQCWVAMEAFLQNGGQIPADPKLAKQLTTREYSYDKKNQLFLESKEDLKERGEDSPDIADGLALTFAFPVIIERTIRNPRDDLAQFGQQVDQVNYNPIHRDRMVA